MISWVGEPNVIKMSVLLKLIYRLDVILILKNPAFFSLGTWQDDSKIHWDVSRANAGQVPWKKKAERLPPPGPRFTKHRCGAGAATGKWASGADWETQMQARTRGDTWLMTEAPSTAPGKETALSVLKQWGICIGKKEKKLDAYFTPYAKTPNGHWFTCER